MRNEPRQPDQTCLSMVHGVDPTWASGLILVCSMATCKACIFTRTCANYRCNKVCNSACGVQHREDPGCWAHHTACMARNSPVPTLRQCAGMWACLCGWFCIYAYQLGIWVHCISYAYIYAAVDIYCFTSIVQGSVFGGCSGHNDQSSLV